MTLVLQVTYMAKKGHILLKFFEFAVGIECNAIVQYIVYTFVLISKLYVSVNI